MAFSLSITSSGDREFKKLPKTIRNEIITILKVLEENPMKGEPLRGKHKGLRSLHFTITGVHYRAIYEMLKSAVLIHRVGTRENIYRKLERAD